MSAKVRQALIQFIGGGVVPIEDNAESYIRNGYEHNPIVRMCTDFIASRAATIPIRLYSLKKDGSEEEVAQHPAVSILQRPNKMQSAREFKRQLFAFYLVTGNGFLGMIRRKEGKKDSPIIRLHNLPPQHVDIEVDMGSVDLVKGYKLNNVMSAQFPATDVIHIRDNSLNYDAGQWLYGQSVLKSGRRALSLSNSTYEAMQAMAKNQGARGMLSQKPSDQVEPLSADQLRNLKEKVADTIEGERNRGRIATVNTPFEFLQFGMSGKDLQLIENHQRSMADICSLYHLPTLLFNEMQAASYNNMKEAKKNAYNDAVLPLIRYFCEKLTIGLLTDKEQEAGMFFRPDISDVSELKPDRAAQASALAQAYWIPTSEKQRQMEIEQDGQLSEYYLPSNLIPSDLTGPFPDGDVEMGSKFGDFGTK